MMVPAEQALREALARFAEARIEHDVLPTGFTSRAVEDTSYTLCVMTGTQTIADALHAADTLVERYRKGRTVTQDDETLAA
ncbi:DUF5133 domain-containing protein [Streptomyces sp. NPDC005573]|uniref:DUF5133 domain-containing protein n=1 Tax=unclassified Streptomyces TaxID=2593676 RepID=UPI0033B55E21